VLGHADARDRIERAVRQLAVVGHTDLDPLGQTGLRDALAGQLGLPRRERHAGDGHPVVACRMDREAAPATADVEHAHARSQRELARHELELRALGLLESLRAAREDRAAVGHRLVEEQCEEVVADVVVVANSRRVALDAVQLPAQDQLQAGHARDPARRGRPGDRQAEARAIPQAERRGLPLVDDDERSVEVIDGERAVDVGTTEPERAGGAQEVRQRRGVAHEERRAPGLRRGDRAAVPEAHVEGPRREGARQRPAERRAGANQSHAPTLERAS